MPRLKWGRITEQRIERLNEILSGTDMDLVTTDTTEAALYRNFLPVGFKTWGEYLEALSCPKYKVVPVSTGGRSGQGDGGGQENNRCSAGPGILR